MFCGCRRAEEAEIGSGCVTEETQRLIVAATIFALVPCPEGHCWCPMKPVGSTPMRTTHRGTRRPSLQPTSCWLLRRVVGDEVVETFHSQFICDLANQLLVLRGVRREEADVPRSAMVPRPHGKPRRSEAKVRIWQSRVSSGRKRGILSALARVRVRAAGVPGVRVWGSAILRWSLHSEVRGLK